MGTGGFVRSARKRGILIDYRLSARTVLIAHSLLFWTESRSLLA